MDLRICHLYPDLLNLYGDRGNVATLVRRAQWRGLDVHVLEARLGEAVDPGAADLFFIGGGEDRQQRLAAPDLRAVKGSALREAAADGAVVLAVCGGYQLLGHAYRPADGPVLEGLGLLDLETVHPGPGARRLIGNIVVRDLAGGRLLVGFENHGGRTRLGSAAAPLGTVVAGFGNNGEDRTEGAVAGTVYGTYLHGPLLPKNAWFADQLIVLALRRRWGDVTLAPLSDAEEDRAAVAAAARAGVRVRLDLGLPDP
ncbi:MAG: glutamine amidotransferase [Armatimonadota bacterium]|nr:glutamine amidotransferase [Armatimonadota bacterium]MDR7421298.1 glutamine amidotransferase [Armatimonadota bacterium]MDR7455152.1 glutamine amidotransferase [Armatimonadota bacterium]MDR7455779.1 glutamine amidotransferase [Armatimonadota bacterium]MDR7496437.1 glutamine amidotransferase [Armatimonadota bacterium]